MVCNECGRENREGARFCDGCGGRLEMRCAECAAELRADARFCDACGKPVAATAPAPEARKVVTIVFADVVGSTPLQARIDAESARNVMSRFYDAMRTVLEEHGGQVQKFIGDAVLAVFGFPTVHEDDAERAVRAASAMVAALGDLNEEIERRFGVRIGMRTGVNTGEVVESSEGLVVGDPVNVAARLEQTAADGEVLIGEATWRLVRDKVTLQPIPPLDLKGKAEPVTAFRLVSVDPPGAESSAPFVGRDDELATLLGTFDRALTETRARIATVIGSAGVGKTRLASELASAVSGRALVLEARCEAAGTSTFAPIADALRTAAAIDESASDEAVVDALTALLPSENADRERIAGRAATVLGAGEPGPPEETFWGIRRIFEALARQRPLVLVLDDVHWAEPMLLDLIEHLADWTRDAAILLLALARPDIRESRPSLGEPGGRDATIVLLEGLDTDSSVRLAQDLLDADQLPPALIERVLVSSEGNPLFLRELLRMLVDDGVLRRDNGSWIVTVDAHEVDVPPTIHALLSARIDRLRADERAVIERASVIGKQFYRGAVAALAPAVAGHLDGHLETLRRKELVEPEGTYWIDEPVFRFHHVLIRDAAYRRLLKEARADLHEKFAAWLEQKAGELVGEHEEVIGYHLEQAHSYRQQLGPLDDAGRDLGRRAAQHLANAGRRAIERDDLLAAAPLLGRALERLDVPDADILIDRCEALLGLGDVANGAQCVEELGKIADTPRLQAWAECFTAQYSNLVDPAHLHETAERAARAAEQFAEIGDAAGAAKAHHVHAETLGRLGQMAASEAALDRALASAREADDRRRANSVLGGIPFASLWGPNSVARASGRCLDVIRVLRITTGSPAVEARALRCQAVLEALRGRHDAARKMLESSRSTLEELGLRHGLLETDVFAGNVELLAGDPAAAEHTLRGAYEGLTRLGLDADAAYAAALLARSLLSQGRNDEAEELTRESERLGGEDLRTSILWRAVRGAAISRRGEVDESLRLAREAVALAEETDAVIDHGDARRALSLALSEAGRNDEAEAEVARAIELYEAKGATAAAERAQGAALPTSAVPQHVHRGDADLVQKGAGGVRAAAGVDPAHVALWTRTRAAIASHDWDAYATSFDADVVVTDSRRGLRSEVVGREAFVEGIAATYVGREVDTDLEIVSSRGRAGILRMTVLGDVDDDGGAFESSRLTVYEMSADDDVIVRIHFLDADANDDAYALLREWSGPARAARAAPGVDPQHVALWTRVVTTFALQDWATLGGLFHTDAVVSDTRSGLRSEVSQEAFMKGIAETYGGHAVEGHVELLASRNRAGVVRMVISGDFDDTGGLFESNRLVVYALARDADVITRYHLLDADAHDEAFALLHEWAGPIGYARAGPGVDPSHQAVLSHITRAFAAQDWEALVAVYDPDLVVTDVRSGLRSEVRGREAWIEGIASTYTGRAAEGDIEIVATRNRAGLVRMVMRGDVDDKGGYFESGRLVLYELAHDADVVTRYHYLDADAQDEAFALLDEWGGRVGSLRVAPGCDPGHVEFWGRFRGLLAAKDWETFACMWRDDGIYRDVRPGLQSEAVGGAESSRILRESFGSRESFDYDLEVLVTRGDAGFFKGLAFGRGDAGGGPWESERLVYYVLDDDLRISLGELHEPSDLDMLRTRLDERAATHGAVRPLSARHQPRFEKMRSTFVARDWDGFASNFRPDLVVTDDRSGLRSEVIGRDALVDGVRETYDQRRYGSDWRIIESRGRAGIVWQLIYGLGDADGGPWESERLLVYELDADEDLVARGHYVDPDKRDEAFALFHEWAGGATAAPKGSRPDGVDQSHEAFWARVQHTVANKQWDSFSTLIRHDIRYLDRRPGLHSDVAGREEMVRVLRESYGTREMDYKVRVLATRGDAGVAEAVFSGPGDDLGGPWETERVYFYVLDGDLLAEATLFNPEDRERALALLNDHTRHTGGVRGAPGTDPVHVANWNRWREAMITKDWEAAAAVTHPQVVVRDHRLGLQSEVVGREDTIRAIRESFGTRLFDYDMEILSSRGQAGVAAARIIGPGDDAGGPWETERLVVYEWDADGLQTRYELFEPHDLESAYARLRELAGGGVRAAPGVDARFMHVWEHARSALVAKEWDQLAELFHPDYVYTDHRPGLHTESVGGADYIRIIRESFGTRDFDYDVEIIASRGNACVNLNRFFGSGDELGGPWEAERLILSEFDEHDRMLRSEFFEADQSDVVLAKLDEHSSRPGTMRAPAGADPVHIDHWKGWREALVAKDWATFASFSNPDVIYVDHRPGLQAEFHGTDEMIRAIRDSYATRAMDYDIELKTTRGASGVFLGRVFGPGDDLGGPWESERLVLYELGAGNKLAGFELFEPGDRDTVYALLRERAGGGVRTSVEVDQRHIASWERFRAALSARDWDAFARALDPNITHVDRRSGLRSEITGTETYIHAMRESFGTRAIDYDMEVLAATGNAGVVHGVFFGPGDEAGGPFEAERLVFYELDENGRFVHFELLDPDDRKSALALLQEKDTTTSVRSAPGTDPTHRPYWEHTRAAIRTHDWPYYATLLAPDMVLRDLRPGLRSEVNGGEALARQLRETYDSRQTDYDVEIVATRGRSGIAMTCFSGPGDDLGGPWEQPRLLIYELDETHEFCVRASFVEPDQMGQAFSVLCEYAGGGVRAQPGVGERFVRALDRYQRAFVTRDWDAVASYLHEDLVYADRQPGLRTESDRDGYLEGFRSSYGTREFDLDLNVLATRGDALVTHARWFGSDDDRGGPWETDRYTLIVLDDADITTRIELFESSEAALAELEKYSQAGGGVSAADGVPERFVRASENMRSDYVAKDWDAVRDGLDDDFVFIDNRSGLRNRSGPDEYVQAFRESYGSRSLDVEIEIIAARDKASVNYIRWFGSGDEYGGPWETDRIALTVFTANWKFARVELFDANDRASALARLDELLEPSAVRSAVGRFIDAYNARDWTALEALIATDFVHDDHRPLGWGTAPGFEAFFARVKIGLEESPDAQLGVDWIRERGDSGMFGMPMHGHVADGGGDWQLDRVMIAVVRDDQLVRLEAFGTDQLQFADERFDALSTG